MIFSIVLFNSYKYFNSQFPFLKQFFIHLKEVRWLSLGNAEERLIELAPQVLELVHEKASTRGVKVKKMLEIVDDEKFWVYVAYMADLFSKLNETCVAMQGEEINVFDVRFFLYRHFIIIIFYTV